MDDGSLVKEFSEHEVYAPLSTIVETIPTPDLRFVERLARPIEEDFPVGSNVFLISTHPDNCGAYSEIVSHRDNAVDIKFSVCFVYFLMI
jgi:5'-3' exonuclease